MQSVCDLRFHVGGNVAAAANAEQVHIAQGAKQLGLGKFFSDTVFENPENHQRQIAVDEVRGYVQDFL